MPDEGRDQVPLLLVVAFLVRWRRLLLALPLTVALLTAVISSVMPGRYASGAVVRLPQGPGNGLILGYEPGRVCLSILYSRWMCERVITRFDLATVYDLPADGFELLMQALMHRVIFVEDDTTKNLLLTVEDASPRRAREMTEFYLDQLDVRGRELQTQRAADEYRFLDARLSEVATTLRQLEDSLCRYQLETGVYNVGAQAQNTLQMAAAIDAQRLMVRTRRELVRQLLGAATPDATYWQVYAAGLDSSLAQLQRAQRPAEHHFRLSLDAIPAHQRACVRLQREIAAYEELAGSLTRLREQARIDAARDAPLLIRIDAPAEVHRRIWPRRRLMVMLAAAVSFVFTAVGASLYETLAAAARDPGHPLAGQVARIREAWTTRR